MIKGLSSNEARDRLSSFGYNELPSEKPKNVFRIVMEVMKEPMFTLLIICGVLYIFIGDLKEGFILLSSILIIIFITFYQHQKTENALNALKNLSSPRALVLRDQNEIRISGREVVPDDVVILQEGDRVPADGILLKSRNLTIDESLLTGESLSVEKDVTNDIADKNGLVYSGTLVVQGKAYAKILNTGINTQFGKIGTSLLNIEQEETKMQKEMKSLIRYLFIIGAFISVGVVVTFYLVRGNFIQSLLNGLASAMAILPEEFPVVLTIFLALGAWRLSKKNVLTRKPSAIETLGSATILCSDKTGTITQNKMDIAIINNSQETYLKKDFEKNKNDISKILDIARFASQENSIDPMEKAIVNAYNSLNNYPVFQFNLVKEYAIHKSLLAMTRILKNNIDNTTTVACKGAPEAIFDLCNLSSEEKEKHLKTVENFAEQGYRVIAVADSFLENNSIPNSQLEFKYHFLGLIGLEDPIREEVPKAIKECKEAGIKVIMITGDFPTTAKSIAQQIGLQNDADVMTGDVLAKITDEELRKKIATINIFARVAPEQKLRIVQALKANQEIVAMTGDGVNDAPALKAANIGISMGKKGTDVAREASSLVLLDDNFASIVAAIRLGRKIYDNLQKAMSYIIAIHIPIIGLTLLPAFISSLPVLLLPLHIVFLELIIDPICSIAFEYEQEEKFIMNRKPRKYDTQFFGINKIFTSMVDGILLLAMTLAVYFLSIKEGHTDQEVRAIAFSALIIGNLFLILSKLSRTRSFFEIFKEKNWAVWIILSLSLVILMLIISVPVLQNTFSFQFPGKIHFLSSLLGAVSLLFILEVMKYLKNKTQQFY